MLMMQSKGNIMKIETFNLTGAALDWAVAKCESKLPRSYDDWKQAWPHYSTDWSQGGPIIEREEIDTYCYTSPKVSEAAGLWIAEITGTGFKGRGPTPLIAAMRCYVASKLGDEVEVPDELF